MSVRCLATAVGYDNVCVREPGDEFTMPDGTKSGTWFTVLKAQQGSKPVARGGSDQKPTDSAAGTDVA